MSPRWDFDPDVITNSMILPSFRDSTLPIPKG